jgi:hypothetical protein
MGKPGWKRAMRIMSLKAGSACPARARILMMPGFVVIVETSFMNYPKRKKEAPTKRMRFLA